ncbi:MAG: ABC transporter permease [Ardenticatenales bacterium]|nr:ABC transporter permease [Ardenticatenales bacterium]
MLSNETHLQERAPQRPLVEKRWWETLKLRWEWATLPLGLLVLLASWQLVVVVGDYPEFVLPSPMAVAAKFVTAIWSGLLWRHLRVTLAETLLGFMLGFLTATLMGYWLAKRPVAERLIAPWLVAMQAVPVVAVAPLLVIWFGFGLTSKVLVCALIVFFPVLINTIVGVRSVDRDWLELMTVLRASRWQRFRLVEVPAALPVLFGGIKLGVTLAVVGAVVGEFVGAREGLGALINIARGGLYDTPLLFVALLSLAGMALALYGIVVFLEQRLVRWQR